MSGGSPESLREEIMCCMPCRPYGVYAVLALLHMFFASPLQAAMPESAAKPLRAALLLEHDGGD
ncbi:hypothetical protein AGMMS49925_09760 [Deltaproteobacteria bacterium]|nr:hypothetical protein AGMMS49925_09760 [Deltaproteobacteria bacterium]